MCRLFPAFKASLPSRHKLLDLSDLILSWSRPLIKPGLTFIDGWPESRTDSDFDWPLGFRILPITALKMLLTLRATPSTSSMSKQENDSCKFWVDYCRVLNDYLFFSLKVHQQTIERFTALYKLNLVYLIDFRLELRFANTANPVHDTLGSWYIHYLHN